MTNHEEFLRKIYTKITPGGHLIVSVPNVRYFEHLKEVILQRDWKYREWGILDDTHYRFFTFKSLKRSLVNNKFQIVKLEGTNSQIKGWKAKLFLKVVTTLSPIQQDMWHRQIGVLAKK